MSVKEILAVSIISLIMLISLIAMLISLFRIKFDMTRWEKKEGKHKSRDRNQRG